jgi:TfoX/Sxy family transcriptional regulator of competence genes
MTFDEALASRVREALAGTANITERRMFGGLAFMRDGRMCVTVGNDHLMLRVDPASHDELVQRRGCTTVTMRGRPYRGWVNVAHDAVATDAALRRWIALATAYIAPQRSSR